MSARARFGRKNTRNKKIGMIFIYIFMGFYWLDKGVLADGELSVVGAGVTLELADDASGEGAELAGAAGTVPATVAVVPGTELTVEGGGTTG